MASTATNGGATGTGGADEQEDLCFEVVATVLEIFGRMDSLVSKGEHGQEWHVVSNATHVVRGPQENNQRKLTTAALRDQNSRAGMHWRSQIGSKK